MEKEEKMAKITVEIEVGDGKYCFIYGRDCENLGNGNWCRIFHLAVKTNKIGARLRCVDCVKGMTSIVRGRQP